MCSMKDDERLRDERKKAKKNKDKYIGMSSDSMGFRLMKIDFKLIYSLIKSLDDIICFLFDTIFVPDLDFTRIAYLLLLFTLFLC